MRIALISAAFPHPNDEDPYLSNDLAVALALRDAGHEILILTFDHVNVQSEARSEKYGGMNILRVGIGCHKHLLLQGVPSESKAAAVLTNALHIYRACRDELNKFCPDVIETQSGAELALFFALEQRYPLIIRCSTPLYSGDQGEEHDLESQLTQAMFYISMSLADGLIVSCKKIAREVSSELGISENKLALITVPNDKLRNLEKSNLNGKQFPKLYYWAQTETKDGLNTLMSTLPRLTREFPDLLITIAGIDKNSVFQNEIISELRARLTNSRFLSHLYFSDSQSRETTLNAAKEADICIFPPTNTITSFTASEAAAHGLCVVTMDDCDGMSYIEHEKTGFVIPPFDAYALGHAIIRLCRDTKLRERLASNAKELIPQICSSALCAKKSEELYIRCIEQRSHQHTDGPVNKVAKENVFKCINAFLKSMPVETEILQSAKKNLSFGCVSSLQEAYDMGFEQGQSNEFSWTSLLSVLRSGVAHKLKGRIHF